MENKNILRTFCGCKPSKIDTWSNQRFTGRYQKAKIEINCGENYLINITLNVKTRFVWEKKKNRKISEMLFIKQAQTFARLIVFCGPSCILISSHLPRKN